jgi:hypothetical protein
VFGSIRVAPPGVLTPARRVLFPLFVGQHVNRHFHRCFEPRRTPVPSWLAEIAPAVKRRRHNEVHRVAFVIFRIGADRVWLDFRVLLVKEPVCLARLRVGEAELPVLLVAMDVPIAVSATSPPRGRQPTYQSKPMAVSARLVRS